MTESIVIVGAGQAGAQAAASLRQKGFEGRITLIGAEPQVPYQRPPLSKKFLSGELTEERLYIKPERFYRDKDIELRLSTDAQNIARRDREVVLRDGESISYDKLLLALGSHTRRLSAPGADLAGIHYLRTIADVREIQEHFQAGKKLVIVGGGYIGLEVAAVATAVGLDVVVVEALDRVMARVVAPEVSEFYARVHRDAGVDVRCNTAVSGFAGRDRVESVLTSDDEQLDCDLAIVGIGIAPQTELAQSAGLTCDNGIRVDAATTTDDPRIFAAGDCTSHPSALLGGYIRLESVANAIEQGKTAAAAMLGEAPNYDEVPWFWSDQYDLKLQIVGLSQDYDQVVTRGNPDDKSFAVFYLKSGRVAAVDAINRPREFMQGKKLVRAAARLSAERLADDDTPIGEITKLALASG